MAAEPTPKPAKRSRIPSDFTVTDAMRAWAAEPGNAPDVDLDLQTRQYVDHWLSKGELRADWTASWRTWMRKQQTWLTERGGPRAGSTTRRYRDDEWTLPAAEPDLSVFDGDSGTL